VSGDCVWRLCLEIVSGLCLDCVWIVSGLCLGGIGLRWVALGCIDLFGVIVTPVSGCFGRYLLSSLLRYRLLLLANFLLSLRSWLSLHLSIGQIFSVVAAFLVVAALYIIVAAVACCCWLVLLLVIVAVALLVVATITGTVGR
jgi:hypothetical protein